MKVPEVACAYFFVVVGVGDVGCMFGCQSVTVQVFGRFRFGRGDCCAVVAGTSGFFTGPGVAGRGGFPLLLRFRQIVPGDVLGRFGVVGTHRVLL